MQAGSWAVCSVSTTGTLVPVTAPVTEGTTEMSLAEQVPVGVGSTVGVGEVAGGGTEAPADTDGAAEVDGAALVDSDTGASGVGLGERTGAWERVTVAAGVAFDGAPPPWPKTFNATATITSTTVMTTSRRRQ